MATFNDLKGVLDTVGAPYDGIKAMLDVLDADLTDSREGAADLLVALETPPQGLTSDQLAVWNAVVTLVMNVANAIDALNT